MRRRPGKTNGITTTVTISTLRGRRRSQTAIRATPITGISSVGALSRSGVPSPPVPRTSKGRWLFQRPSGFAGQSSKLRLSHL